MTRRGQIDLGGNSVLNATVPVEQLCHYITDLDLDNLGKKGESLAKEICLVSVGIFAGSLLPSYAAFQVFSTRTENLSGQDLLAMLICALALLLSMIFGMSWMNTEKKHSKLLQHIRARPKVRVTVNK